MKYFYYFSMIISVIFAGIQAGAAEVSRIPVYYPEGIIANSLPYFIWYDKYNERDNKTKYRITLKQDKGQDINPVLVNPDLYNDHYYFRFPFPLESGKYTYKIERLAGNKTSEVKYFYYLKYPINGEFELDRSEDSRKDNLPPDKLIDYLTLEKKNKLENRNNFIFYSSAGLGAFGIGLLFYTVLDFGLVSRIISVIAFTSSAAGLGAAGYYAYNYMSEKRQLQKIIDISGNVSINGGISSEEVCWNFKFSF